MSKIEDLIKRLELSMQESFSKILDIPEDYLDQPSRHSCARGRNVWDLLTHNIEHERQHMGQIVGLRDAMDRLQQDRKTKLLAELYVARSMLIGSLIGLSDSELNQSPIEGEWNIEQIVDHIIYWDRNSIDDLEDQYKEQKLGAVTE